MTRGIVLFLLAATAVLHRGLVSLHTGLPLPQGKVEWEIPAEISSFRQAGEDIEIEPRIYEILEYPEILMRNYASRDGRPIQLTIVSSGPTRRSLHFPEVCLTGQGWETREQYSAPVGLQFIGKRLVLTRHSQEEAVLYWFKTGDYFTDSYLLNSLYWSRERLLLRPTDSMMVKLSTPVVSQDSETAFAVLEDFAAALAPILMEKF